MNHISLKSDHSDNSNCELEKVARMLKKCSGHFINILLLFTIVGSLSLTFKTASLKAETISFTLDLEDHSHSDSPAPDVEEENSFGYEIVSFAGKFSLPLKFCQALIQNQLPTYVSTYHPNFLIPPLG